jgi:RHS repeat-associated protein
LPNPCYGGDRTVKYNLNNETVYVDKMYQIQASANPWLITKHIFVGDTRIVSKLSYESSDADANYEKDNTYYYHGDHLGSSNFITDKDGAQYEQYLFTPYGETWVEEQSDSLDKINFKFTSKELDEETGLYYFGARYLEPQTSRWMNTDPIYSKYLDSKVGEGGIYNSINSSLYTYAGNNPLMYTDPDGKIIQPINMFKADIQRQWEAKNVQLGQNTATNSAGNPRYNLYNYGCYVTALTNVLNSFKHDKYGENNDKVYTIFDSNNVKDAFRSGDGLVNGMAGSLKILGQNDYVKSLGLQYIKDTPDNIGIYTNDKDNLYFVVGEVTLGQGQHYFNILTAPDANGDYMAWDGWQTGSPYVKKNVRDLTGIRVFKMQNKKLVEQLQQINTQGLNPKKTYIGQEK